MGVQYTINNEHKKEMFKKLVDKLYEERQYITFTYTFGKPRSPKQQAALEVYFKEAAKRLNDAGTVSYTHLTLPTICSV